MKILIPLAFILLSVVGTAQDLRLFPKHENKGNMYIYWGWNREWFSDSDIHFKGETYDFTLYDVKAQDRPEEFDIKTYFSPAWVTVPQYNFKLGYFFKNNWHGSIGIDHMKYVVQKYQTVKIDGRIAGTATPYNNTYYNEDIDIRPGFMQLEHTDGLNVGSVDFGRFDDILDYKKIRLSVTESVGVGILFPKTDSHLFNYKRYNKYHVSGYGINTTVGLNLKLYKAFFIQSEVRGGYINMPNVRTTVSASDIAKQEFYYFQVNWLFGARFPIHK